MIAATYTQGGAFTVEDVPVPEIGAEEILLRVMGTSICGTDTKIIRNGHRKLQPGQKNILGHEFAGVIARVGSHVKDFREGMRIGVAPNWGCGHCEACRRDLANYCPEYSAFGIDQPGSHAEFVRLPKQVIQQGNIVPLPEGMPWRFAALAEPLSCVVQAQRTVDLQAGEAVAVYGCGPMGLLNVLLAAASGAEKILAIDPNPARRERALALGATRAIVGRREDVRAEVMEETSGRGVDVVITAAPDPQIPAEGLTFLAPFGRLCLFAGLPRNQPQAALDGNAIHYRKLQVTGTSGGSNQDYREAINLIDRGSIDLSGIVSHGFMLNELESAYKMALSGEGIKIVLTADT
jgi:L-iditol 2-dehydrogenase